jgi:hypothetical protein
VGDATARTKLIRLQEKHIVELEAEAKRLRKAQFEGKHKRPKFAPLYERVILLLVNGLIMVAMAWVNADNRVAKADQGFDKEVVEIQRDAAEQGRDHANQRAVSWREEAELYVTEALREGCTFENTMKTED